VPAETDVESHPVQHIKTEFNSRCAQAGIPGQLAVETGSGKAGEATEHMSTAAIGHMLMNRRISGEDLT